MAGKPSPLPDLRIQYADFAVWQRGWMQSDIFDRQLSYWRKQLDGAPEHLGVAHGSPASGDPELSRAQPAGSFFPGA